MSDKQPVLRAPKHLRPQTKAWWRHVVGTWELEAHHLRLLTLAAESWDRCQQAREQLEADGLTISTRDGGLKRHPCCAIESESRIAFARLIRELDLDVAPPAEAKRPPALRSIAGARHAS